VRGLASFCFYLYFYLNWRLSAKKDPPARPQFADLTTEPAAGSPDLKNADLSLIALSRISPHALRISSYMRTHRLAAGGPPYPYPILGANDPNDNEPTTTNHNRENSELARRGYSCRAYLYSYLQRLTCASVRLTAIIDSLTVTVMNDSKCSGSGRACVSYTRSASATAQHLPL
jgi:hypothetical protein